MILNVKMYYPAELKGKCSEEGQTKSLLHGFNKQMCV